MGVAEGESELCQGEAINAVADVGVAEVSTRNIAERLKLAYQNSGRGGASAVEAGGKLLHLCRPSMPPTSAKWMGNTGSLSSAALRELGARNVHGNGLLEAIKDFVGGVLQARVGLVQLACGLRGKLTQLVTVVDVSHCSKNQV